MTGEICTSAREDEIAQLQARLRETEARLALAQATSFDSAAQAHAASASPIAQHAHRLAGLVEAQQILAAAEVSVVALLAMVPAMAQRLLGCEAAVFECHEGDELVYQHGSGLAEPFVGMRLSLNSSLSGEALRQGRTLMVNDTDDDLRVDAVACRVAGARSMLITLLRTADGPYGAIKIFSVTPQRFTQADASSLELLSEFLRVVIQRRRATDALTAGAAQYRLLFDSNPHPMWAFDVETLRFLTVNQAAIDHYGYGREEWLQMNLLDIRPISDVSPMEEWRAHGPMSGKYFGQWRHRKKNGDLIDVEISADELIFNGRTARLVLAHDVTERLSAEHKLRRSLTELGARNRELKDFAFIASHDLQEPLRKVRAFADRLALNFAPVLQPQGLEYLTHMSSAVSRMQRLIDALLDYSRVLSHSQSLVSVDLDEVVHGVLDDLEECLRKSGGSIRCAPLPVVWGDPSLLGQVFQNLISNALKFTKPGRTPILELRVRDDALAEPPVWVIELEDNGIGFANEFSAKIFAPFQRLHGRDRYEGTGIGLAIVRRIVERHAGNISAHGNAGEGAIFRLVLLKLPPSYLLADAQAGSIKETQN